jgi:Holliday junction resolvasome RuvABC endonuclease subunit
VRKKGGGASRDQVFFRKHNGLRYTFSLCHTGWALYDRSREVFTYGVIEPPKEVTEDLARMEYMLEEVIGLLPGTRAVWPQTVFVVIEGLAFSGRGSYALQLAGLGYMLRREFRNAGIAYREVAPTQAKKFLTGKGNCDKNLILKEVFKRYHIDVDDDNIADAVNFNMIGRALLGWNTTSNLAQQSIVDALNSGPKPKKGKKKSKAA